MDKITGKINGSKLSTVTGRVTNVINAADLQRQIDELKEKDIELFNITNGLKTELHSEISNRIAEAERLLSQINAEVQDRQEADESLKADLLERINNLIYSVRVELHAEIDRAKAAEKNLSDKIDLEEARAIEKENEISADLATEVVRATTAEESLLERISNETARAIAAERLETDRAEAAEAGLQDAIDAEESRAAEAENTLATNLSAEADRAITRENELDIALTNEINRAAIAEEALSQGLTTETERATAAEETLSHGLAAEIERAETAETNLQDAIDSEVSRATAAENALNESLTSEASIRLEKDNDLQSQIDAIESRADVVDVVATKADLNNYDTSTLTDKDVVKVLADESQGAAITYYRWVITGGVGAWTFIGAIGPYYTTTETDTELAKKVDKTTTINGHALSSNITLDASDVNAVSSVGLSMPTGFTVTGSPITSSGTLNVAFTDGYSLPSNSDQTSWTNKYSKPSSGIPDSDLASTFVKTVDNISPVNGNVTLTGYAKLSADNTFTGSNVFSEYLGINFSDYGSSNQIKADLDAGDAITWYTPQLRVGNINNYSEDGSPIYILSDITLGSYKKFNPNTNGYGLVLPDTSGFTTGNKTIATTDDIPAVSLTTTTGSEAITVNSDTLNVVTKDTNQTITGVKTFNDGIIFNDLNSNSYFKIYQNSEGPELRIDSCNDGANPLIEIYPARVWSYDYDNHLRVLTDAVILKEGTILEDTDSGLNIINSSVSITEGVLNAGGVYTSSLRVDGHINSNDSNHGLVLPSTDLYEDDKTVATTDDIPAVSLTTTTGSEAITVNSDSLNVVTRDTNQSISGEKAFGSGKLVTPDIYAPTVSGGTYRAFNLYSNNITAGATVMPSSNARQESGNIYGYDLGGQNYRWRDLYLYRNLSDGQNSTTIANINNNFAPIYSSSSTYAVGDKVIYQGVLYKCSTAIETAEAWTAAHWTAISIDSLDSNVVHKTGNELISGIKTFSKISFSNTIGSTYNSWIFEDINKLAFRTRKGDYDITQGNVIVTIPTLDDPTARNITINFPAKDGTIATTDDIHYATSDFNSSNGTKIATGYSSGTASTIYDLYAPNATDSQAGVITTGTQTFAGKKSFNQTITVSNNDGSGDNAIIKVDGADGTYTFLSYHPDYGTDSSYLVLDHISCINCNANGCGYILPVMPSTATTDKTIATTDDISTAISNTYSYNATTGVLTINLD